MKIILSRKGVDSAAGKMASPLVDGRPVSVCIPTQMPTPTTYGDLGDDIARMVVELSKGRLVPDQACHLDPDLDCALLPRRAGWRGALGQLGAPQSHLDNQGVGCGDVFVFWGLYRPAAKDSGTWRFTGKHEHRVFGWLQVHDVVRVGADPASALLRYPWLVDHPHARAGWPASNTIYIASERLTIESKDVGMPGWGLLQRGLRLTAPGKSPSNWLVPSWLNPTRGGTGMSFHKPSSFSEDGALRAASRGQEFVADVADRRDAMDWLRQLVREH